MSYLVSPRAFPVLLLFAAFGALAASNPLGRFAPPEADSVNGRWNGVDLERRSNCVRPESNGSRGTYAQFDVALDTAGNFSIGQVGITGLNCNYVGRFETVEGRGRVQGTYSCTDGKQGTFQTTRIDASAVALTIQMAIQLTGAETCAIDGILSMARQP
jgi:hypothetical protein